MCSSGKKAMCWWSSNTIVAGEDLATMAQKMQVGSQDTARRLIRDAARAAESIARNQSYPSQRSHRSPSAVAKIESSDSMLLPSCPTADRLNQACDLALDGSTEDTGVVRSGGGRRM